MTALEVVALEVVALEVLSALDVSVTLEVVVAEESCAIKDETAAEVPPPKVQLANSNEAEAAKTISFFFMFFLLR